MRTWWPWHLPHPTKDSTSYKMMVTMFPAGIEPATLSVWRTRDNHYTKEPFYVYTANLDQNSYWFMHCLIRKSFAMLRHGLVAQRITRLTTDQKIAGSNPAGIDLFQCIPPSILLAFFCIYTTCPKIIQRSHNWGERVKSIAPPGGLEPPTFRLTAERASRLRHGGKVISNCAS